jgi:hypothetical protein
MDKTIKDRSKLRTSFPLHGWLGVCLAGLFWSLNWTLEGPRTHWGFFPMWLGYCLTVDGLVYLRRGSSLLTRNWRKYLGLFIISAPVWWIFEIFNSRLQNWHYEGTELFTPLQFWLWATLNFTTVIPAVFGSAELAASFGWIRRLGKGPHIAPERNTTLAFFISGWVMLALLLIWPYLFFPFVWISLYFITEPINVWLGRPNLAEYTAQRDWRPVIALWTGVLITAFFWEMWNFYAFPKWVYHIPWGDALHVFEMPLLGYGGYLPFALELVAMYHLLSGWRGNKQPEYLKLTMPE